MTRIKYLIVVVDPVSIVQQSILSELPRQSIHYCISSNVRYDFSAITFGYQPRYLSFSRLGSPHHNQRRTTDLYTREWPRHCATCQQCNDNANKRRIIFWHNLWGSILLRAIFQDKLSRCLCSVECSRITQQRRASGQRCCAWQFGRICRILLVSIQRNNISQWWWLSHWFIFSQHLWDDNRYVKVSWF